MGKKVQSAVCIFGAGFMLDQLYNLQKEFDGALDGTDIEYVHRMRVATRRLRSGITCFKVCLPKKKSKPWRDEIQRITHALGDARDLDIQIACLNKLYDDSLAVKFKAGYRRILLRLKQGRAKAQGKVTKQLNKFKDSKILSEMQSYLEMVTSQSDDTYLYTPSLYRRAFKKVNTHLDEFLSYQEDIRDPARIDRLHAMRIAGKQLRYTIEIFSPIYDKALLSYIHLMKEVQDQLGAIHDDDVWVSWLPKFIEEEKQRMEDYFGNASALNKLLPGINHLIENRQKDRGEIYQAFLATWDTLQSENAWEFLKEIIHAPIDVDAAMEHLEIEEQEEPDDIIVNNPDTSIQEDHASEDDIPGTPSNY